MGTGARFTTPEWKQKTETPNPDEYWRDCEVLRPDGVTEPAQNLATRLAKPPKEDLAIDTKFICKSVMNAESGNTVWSVSTVDGPEEAKEWLIEAKLTMFAFI